MTQDPHPHDPYGAAQQPGQQPEQQSEQGAPTSDPSLHPHDPYAQAPASGEDLLDVDPAPAAAQVPPPAPATAPQPAPAAQDPYAAPPVAPYAPSAQQGRQAPYGAPTGAQPEDLPPAGTRGVYDGPLSGQPVSRSDSRLWATLSQAAVAVGHVVSWGFLGWVGPLIVFLVYKDRDRFVRFHAAEALNGAIAVFLSQIVLTVLITILAVLTFGFGTILYPLVGLPALVQLVFAIIAAIKANQGEYWNYPVNLRLVK